MRSARLSAAGRGSMLALALTSAALSSGVAGQARSGLSHAGGILVQAVDTSINPLAAEIILPAFGLGVRLSDEGVVLLLNIPDGTYLLQARHIGHRPEWRVIRITGDTARVELVLAPADLATGNAGHGLAESRLRDFLRRTPGIQQGSFVTRAEIDRRRPRNLAALLGRLPELTVDRTGAGATLVRSNRTVQPQCTSGMVLLVDGMLPSPAPSAAGDADGNSRSPRGLRPERVTFGAGIMRPGEPGRWSHPPSARELEAQSAGSGEAASPRNSSPLDWVPIDLVAGVEIYPTVDDIPPEFRVAGSECGVVLVWTVRK